MNNSGYSFFELFWEGLEQIIKEYVAVHIEHPSGIAYISKKLNVLPFLSMPLKEAHKEIIKKLTYFLDESFDLFYLSVLQNILEMLIEIDAEKSISTIIACAIFHSVQGPAVAEDPYDEEEIAGGDTFADDPDTPMDDSNVDEINSIIEVAKSMLKQKLEGALLKSDNDGKEGE